MNISAEKIQALISDFSSEEQKYLLSELMKLHQIHELENVLGAPAEVILEAIHRAPELTRRMLRGVIADAAFAKFIVPRLSAQNWRDDTPEGNHSYDHMLIDDVGRISVQVKLQRSEKGKFVETDGKRYKKIMAGSYLVEVQRTRTGKSKDGDGNNILTRPYRYGDFDILAVSLQPSTNDWTEFRYTVASWLLPGKESGEIETFQPVSKVCNSDWTDDFNQVAEWFRESTHKTIAR